MAFVKLKKSILNSTVWLDRDVRDVWITALLMADLYELRKPTPTIKVGTLKRDSFVVPAGWYGYVAAASTGIIRMAGMRTKEGMKALQTLAAPDAESRTPDHGGRRLVRVDGGFIVLTYDKHRQKDETAAERMRRYRERQRETVTPSQRVTDRHVTHQDQDQDQELDPDQSALRVTNVTGNGLSRDSHAHHVTRPGVGYGPLGRTGAGPRPGTKPRQPVDLVKGTNAKLAEMRAAGERAATPEEIAELRRERSGPVSP